LIVLSPRERFLSYVRDPKGSAPVVSPFLPHQDVVKSALTSLGLPSNGDPVRNEIRLAHALRYEPMFMTDCSALIFPWTIDESRSTQEQVVRAISTRKGEWVRQTPREEPAWSDATGCAVRTTADHEMLVTVCEEIGSREAQIREYFRTWRTMVGDDGVIVIGHPHCSWLGSQISPSAIFYQWNDFPDVYTRSMDAVFEASLIVMSIAMEEKIDFMSDSSYGLEMTSPELFQIMDLPYIQRFASWTHERGGLFWYHNCGFTRTLIMDGIFNAMGADVIETIAPPPEGDNCLEESRKCMDPRICTKGNFSLGRLRDGTPPEIRHEAHAIVDAVRGFPHIFSTADAVLPGTPGENFVALVTSLHDALGA
jgi:hypothetical protein